MRLLLALCIFGVVLVLAVVSYSIYSSSSPPARLNINDTCQQDITTWLCKTRNSCNTLDTRDQLLPCNKGDPSVVCCPPEGYTSEPKELLMVNKEHKNDTKGLRKSPARIPGEKANEMCKVYGKSVYVTLPNPILSLTSQSDYETIICDTHETLIKGGEDAKENEFPHMALLGYFDSTGNGKVSWICGGSLISPSFILSAAHCNITEENGFAMIGTNIIESSSEFFMNYVRRISEVHIHDKYIVGKHYNDIALFKLSKELEISANIRPICLDTRRAIEYGTIIATGWGLNEAQEHNNHLQKVSLNIQNEDFCISAYKNIYRNQVNHEEPLKIVPESQVCAAAPGKDTCKGDSGGPLQVRHKELQCMFLIVGITSFGPNCSLDSNVPGIYTRVSNYVEWIENIVWPY